MSKAHKKRRCAHLDTRQARRRQVEESLEKLQCAGLVGALRMVDGEIQYLVEPKHFALMMELLKHPERWDEAPAIARRRDDFMRLRERAIAKGLIEP